MKVLDFIFGSVKFIATVIVVLVGFVAYLYLIEAVENPNSLWHELASIIFVGLGIIATIWISGICYKLYKTIEKE